MQLFSSQGRRPRHDLGQNFLIDLNLLDLILAAAELGPQDVVLEVGAGTGGLTSRLAASAGRVITVEYDPVLAPQAQAAVGDAPHVTLLNLDALASKHRLAEPIVAAVDAALAEDPAKTLKLVANLPYQIGTAVIANVVGSNWKWSRMVVTVQWELAERMIAGPGTSDFSSLSVWLQSQCRIELLRRLPPTVFWPRPKVDSAIVQLTPDWERSAMIRDRTFFEDWLRRVFSQRRKVLRGVLAREYSSAVSRSAIEEILASQGLTTEVRAEDCRVDQLVAIANALGAVVAAAEGGAESAGES